MPLLLSYVALIDRSCIQQRGGKHRAWWVHHLKDEGLHSGLDVVIQTRPTHRFCPPLPPQSILPMNACAQLPKPPPPSFLNSTRRFLIYNYRPPSTIPPRTGNNFSSSQNFWVATGGRTIWVGGSNGGTVVNVATPYSRCN